MRHLIYLTVISILALWLSFYLAQPRPLSQRVLFPDHHKLFEINDL